MRYPWANILLLFFILADMLSGFFGLISGSQDRAIYIQVHRVSGYGILGVLAWKVANIARSFKWPKKRPVRIASLALAVILVVTLALGLVWSIFGDFSWWMFSGLSWHIYAGVVLAPLLLCGTAGTCSGARPFPSGPSAGQCSDSAASPLPGLSHGNSPKA